MCLLITRLAWNWTVASLKQNNQGFTPTDPTQTAHPQTMTKQTPKVHSIQLLDINTSKQLLPTNSKPVQES
jgi:hypothetical protein